LAISLSYITLPLPLQARDFAAQHGAWVDTFGGAACLPEELRLDLAVARHADIDEKLECVAQLHQRPHITFRVAPCLTYIDEKLECVAQLHQRPHITFRVASCLNVHRREARVRGPAPPAPSYHLPRGTLPNAWYSGLSFPRCLHVGDPDP
jgi:hypothetical protein